MAFRFQNLKPKNTLKNLESKRRQYENFEGCVIGVGAIRKFVINQCKPNKKNKENHNKLKASHKLTMTLNQNQGEYFE